MTDARLPLTIVTGFLGSGKTTLIRHLLEQPGFAGTLVIVNEFGEVGIDHALIEASSDDTILLANGCLCCTIRGNLVDTLCDVLAQRAEGRIGAFDRVVVETSGVADPAPLLAFLLSQPEVTAHYALGALVATCDAVNGTASIASQPEAQSQIRIADRVLLTKCDLVDAMSAEAMVVQLRALNPAAEIHTVVQGRIDPEIIVAPYVRTNVATSVCAHDHDHDHHAHHDHTSRFRCTVLRPARALAEREIAPLMTALHRIAGPTMLRLKGVLPVAGDDRMLVVQGALIVVHAPEWLAAGAVDGRLVVITEGPLPNEVSAELAAFGLRPMMAAEAQMA